MATPQSALALDLTTDRNRPAVTTDFGEAVIRVLEDFSALELVRIDRIRPQVEMLGAKVQDATATDEEAQQYADQLTAFVRMVVDADEGFLEKLSGLGEIKKMRIFMAFTQLSTQNLARLRAKVEELQSDGEKPSPASSASTEETPAPGTP